MLYDKYLFRTSHAQPWFVAVGVALAAVLSACRGTGHAEVKEAASPGDAAPTGGGLDVNDVAMLLPIPKDASQHKDMIGLDLATVSGQPLMSRALHADIIKHFAYTKTIDGRPIKLESGTNFGTSVTLTGAEKALGTRATGPGVRIINDGFAIYENWKVVAFRYDPCAPTPTSNLAKKNPETTFPATFAAERCLPQVRLTVQPVVVWDNLNSSAPRDAPPVAYPTDYTMHLVFSIAPEESRQLYKDLIAFRNGCGNVTSGVPLTVQPCLRIEAESGQFAGPKQQELMRLIKTFAHTYAGISAMGTRLNTDPWVFMNGLVDGDSFQHQPIAAVHKDANQRHNSAGVLIEPFGNGYFQMLSFLGPKTAQGGPASNTNVRVTPSGLAEKNNAFLGDEFNQGSKIGLPVVAEKVRQISNPLHNDFFSTDCVSCHASGSILKAAVPFKPFPPPGFIKSLENDNVIVSGGRAGLPAEAIPTSEEPAGQFVAPEGYTQASDLSAVPFDQLSRTFNPYDLIQFGYFDTRPSISPRVSHEAVKVAWQANRFYGNGASPTATCAPRELRACLSTNITTSRFKATNSEDILAKRGPLLHVAMCMDYVCKERATALKTLFGSQQVEHYRARVDVPLTNRGFGDDGRVFSILKDTVIAGKHVQNDFFFEFQELRADSHYLLSLGYVPIQDKVSGTSAFIGGSLPIAGNWDEMFEAVPM